MSLQHQRTDREGRHLQVHEDALGRGDAPQAAELGVLRQAGELPGRCVGVCQRLLLDPVLRLALRGRQLLLLPVVLEEKRLILCSTKGHAYEAGLSLSGML